MNKTEGNERHGTGILPTFTAYIEQNDGTLKRLIGLMDSGSQNSFIRKGSIKNAKKEIVDSKVLDISTFDTKKCKTSRYNIVDCTLWGTYGNAQKNKYRFIEKEFLANSTEYYPTQVAEQLTKQREKVGRQPK